MTFSQKQKKKSQNSYDSTKAHEQSKQSWAKRKILDVSQNMTSNYAT
jgi:hypothetical protein